LAKADARKEEIKFWTEVFRFVAIIALAVSGGTIGLIRGERTTLDIVLATTGVVGLLLLSIILARLQRHIRGLIGQLQED
jgi:hypothetical protein